MSNIISLEDLEEDEDYEALLEDLRQGCAEFGTVVKLHVPRIHVLSFSVVSSIARREGDSGPGLCVRPVRIGAGGCGRGEGVATEDVQRKAGTGGLLSAVSIHEGGCAGAKE